MKKIISILIILSFVIPVFFAAENKQENRYVNVQKLELKEKPSNFGKEIKTLNYADHVIVIKENGKWTNISLEDGTTGYVTTSSLTKRKIRASGFTASASELSLAGKGFNDEIENSYKQSGEGDFDSVDDMEKLTITNQELLSFIRDGKLNDGDNE